MYKIMNGEVKIAGMSLKDSQIRAYRAIKEQSNE